MKNKEIEQTDLLEETKEKPKKLLKKKEEKKEPQEKKKDFKEELVKSNIAKRISPTTLKTISEQLDKEAALKEIIVKLNPFFYVCKIDDFLELSQAIKELNDL